MSINLSKGQKIDLTKDNSSLTELMVGLGWDAAKGGFVSSLFSNSNTRNIDCDASVFLVNENHKLRETVSYQRLKSSCGSIKHQGDNLTGEGDGDDEQIKISLSKIPSSIHKLVFVVNIYNCVSRCQHFGMIKNAFIRLVDVNINKELAKFNLTEDGKDKTALTLGEVYRCNGEWNFKAIGEFTNDKSISDLERKYR